MNRRSITQAGGCALFLLVMAAICLSAIGARKAYNAHAPSWAFFLFYSVLAISVPVGSIIGYLFHIPRQRKSEDASNAQRAHSV